MLAEVVRAAAEHLQAEGQRVSVRAIHAMVGGSFREITKYLREVLPGTEGGGMEAVEVLPLLRIDEHPDVQDVRERLRTLEGEGADLQRLVDAQQRTVTVLQAELEATENAVFLGQQPASALEKVQMALRGALADLHARQADAAAHQAKQERMTGVAQAKEADAAALVEQHLREAYEEKVRAFYQQFRQAVIEHLQEMRALQEHARREFPLRTVLPHVEPVARPLHPSQPVGLEDLLRIFEHDPYVQALLGDSE